MWTALVTFVVVVATLAAPTGAFAAPGAVGGIDKPYTGSNSGTTLSYLACDHDGSSTFYFCNFDISGWAYNARTRPIQTVRLTMYRGSKSVYTTGELAAQYSDSDAQKAHHLHTANVGWLYNANWQSATWEQMWWWTKACAQAHDKGEKGGWVSIGCVSVHRVKYYDI